MRIFWFNIKIVLKV